MDRERGSKSEVSELKKWHRAKCVKLYSWSHLVSPENTASAARQMRRVWLIPGCSNCTDTLVCTGNRELRRIPRHWLNKSLIQHRNFPGCPERAVRGDKRAWLRPRYLPKGDICGKNFLTLFCTLPSIWISKHSNKFSLLFWLYVNGIILRLFFGFAFFIQNEVWHILIIHTAYSLSL